MFKSLNGVSYPVSDIARAKEWYSGILGIKPAVDTPLIVVFRIGESSLMLVPSPEPQGLLRENTIAYWDVDDADEAYNKLLEHGARKHTDVSISVGNNRIARVYDPFGNILGILSKPAGKNKSLRDKPSESALTVAFCRALSAHDDRPMYNSGDNLAEIFLNDDALKSLGNPDSRQWLLRNMMTPGVYEFFIARTKYFDTAFKEAINNNINQVVFLGAGYDTRAIRMSDLLGKASVFEVDAPPTQQRKIECLMKTNLLPNPNLVFVPMDFENDTFSGVLEKAGYDFSAKSLFIWEGVTYYLDIESVVNTLNFVRDFSPSGSQIVFDYICEAPDILERYGVKVALDTMKTVYEAERAGFSIQEGTAGKFLAERGLKLIEHLSAEEIGRKYFSLPDGSQDAAITAMFSFAKAEVL